MKHIYFFLIISIFTVMHAFSQTNEIAHWYLQYIEKDGVVYPNYYNEFQNMDIVFIENLQNPGIYEFTANSSCNGLSGTFTSDVELPTISSTIYVNNLAMTDQDCGSTPVGIYEDLFLDVFLNNNSGLPVTFSYEITPIENDDPNPSPPPPPKLTLTNNSGDALVYYLTLPNNGVLVQEWFLSRIETPGNEAIIIPITDTPSLNITNEINFLTFRPEITGTGDCNVFMSDYEISLNNGNNIQLLDFNATLALCKFSDYEPEYFTILSNSSTNFCEFEIINNGQTLILTDLLGAQLVFNDDPLSIQNFQFEDLGIQLKMNPVKSHLLLNIPDNIRFDLEYRIYDITGKQINSKILTSDNIDVSSLNSGMYFIQFNSEINQSQQTLRFIKQ